MGWWEQDAEGNSLVVTGLPDEKKLLWGDGPADVIDSALAQVKIEFLKDLGRMPSRAEIVAGIAFSTRVMDELAEVPEHAPHMDAEQDAVIQQYGYASYGYDTAVSEHQREAWAKVRAVLDALENEPEAEETPEAAVPESAPDPLSQDDLGLIRAMRNAVFGEKTSIVLPSGRTVSGLEMARLVKEYGGAGI